MAKLSSYRSWAAGLLTLLFVTVWFAKTLHGLFYHADHHDRPICSTEQDHAAAHIHDTRYAADDCSFCALALGTSALTALPVLFLPTGTKAAAKAILFYQPPCTRLVGSFAPPRGPPAL